MAEFITQREAQRLVAAVRRILDALEAGAIQDIDVGDGDRLSDLLIDSLPAGEEL